MVFLWSMSKKLYGRLMVVECIVVLYVTINNFIKNYDKIIIVF